MLTMRYLTLKTRLLALLLLAAFNLTVVDVVDYLSLIHI